MGKISREVEINSDGDSFFEFFVYKSYLIPTLSPLITASELYEGEWGTLGCVMLWSNIHDGKVIVDKEVISHLDKETKTMTLKYLEGVMLQMYKMLDSTIQVDKKGDKSVVTWIVEYEKLNEDVPDPTFVLDLFQSLTKSIDESEHVKH